MSESLSETQRANAISSYVLLLANNVKRLPDKLEDHRTYHRGREDPCHIQCCSLAEGRSHLASIHAFYPLIHTNAILAILAQTIAYGVSGHYVTCCISFGCLYESRLGHT
jgi:hypothetical protein